MSETLRPHKVTGLIKFMTTKEEFNRLASRVLLEVAEHPDKIKIEFDQILILGTVDGQDVFEVRFIKFIDDASLDSGLDDKE